MNIPVWPIHVVAVSRPDTLFKWVGADKTEILNYTRIIFEGYSRYTCGGNVD